MQQGPARFEKQLEKLETLMLSASKDHNPALFLYSNDARTPLFMLEALSRLYRDLHNKKKFQKLRDEFKFLEDALGSIDYYECYAKSFLEHPNVPVNIREYMQAQGREKIQGLNDYLVKEKWIGEKANKIKKLKSTLKEIDWMAPKEEMKAIRDFYEDEIEEIKDAAKDIAKGFTEMENEVHEFRRDLRWLSIYPHALNGSMQTLDSGLSAEATAEYLAPEILQSKYNVMPDAGDNKWFLLLEKNYFYALSWLIAELGKIKDEGLKYYAATEAYQQIEALAPKEARQKAMDMFGAQENNIQQLLADASNKFKRFMEKENLDRLVIGLANTKKGNSK
jgi:hypothetical protein